MRLRLLCSVALVFQAALWASPAWSQSGSGESQTGRLESVRPRLTGIAVPGLRTVTATFSEPLFTPGTSVPSNYTLSGPGRGTLGSTPGGSAGGSGPIRLDWNSGEMRNGAAITLSVSGLQDAVGNPINPAFASTGGTGVGVPPVFSGLVVQPAVAGPGQEVLLRFTASEPLSGPPLVRVGEAEALRLEEPGYVYAYTVDFADPVGPSTVTISGQDDAGNPGTLSVPGALEIVLRVGVAPGESVQEVIDALPQDQPALVELEPGDYDEAVVLRPGVRLVGSGPETRLAPPLDALGPNGAVLTGADRASAESLTVVLPGEETTGVLAVDAGFTMRELAVEGGLQAGTVGIAIVGSGAKGAGEAVSVVRDCALAELDLALDVDGAEALVSFNLFQDIFGTEAVRASGADGLLPSLGSLEDLVNTGSNTFEGIAGELYSGPATPGALAQANYWDNLPEETQVQQRVTGALDAANPLYYDETGKELIPASLFVSVLDAQTDAPIPGARVTLVYNLAPLPEAAGLGVYSSAALASGRYTVRVRKAGYDEAVELVELQAGINEAVVYLGTPGGTEGEGEGATEGEGEEGANEGEGDGNTEGEGEGEPPAPTSGCNCQGGAKGLPAAPSGGDLLVGLAAIGTLFGLGLQRRAHALARAGSAALLLAGAMLCAPGAGAQCADSPLVTNVSFEQRPNASGTEVLITYDLQSICGPCDVTVALSKNGGTDGYPFPVTTLSGQREGVQPGEGRTLLWDFASDYPEQDISQARLRVTAQVTQKEPLAIEMIPVPAGSFQMGRTSVGDDATFGLDDELPVHTVILSAYEIGKYEVTKQQVCNVYNWATQQGLLEVVDQTGPVAAEAYGVRLLEVGDSDQGSYGVSYGIDFTNGTFSPNSRPGLPVGTVYSMGRHPINLITWYGAVAFCNWLSQMEGLTPVYDTTTWEANFANNGYHLPTEAQWERAAAWDGTKHWIYGFTSDTLAGKNRANYSDFSSLEYVNPLGLTAFDYTSPVGWFDGVNVSPNGNIATVNSVSPVGAYDMSGNVAEWCHDWYGKDYYSVSPTLNPTGPASGSNRVTRNGNWYSYGFYSRSAYRGNVDPTLGYNVGFRLAR